MPSSTLTTGSIQDALKGQPTSDFLTFLVNQGEAFVTSTRITGLSNGASEYIYIENTETLDYDVAVLPRATGLADIDISFGATENTAGSDMSVTNLKSGSGKTFNGVIRRTGTDTDYSHGEFAIQDFIPGSGVGANIGAEIIDAIAFTIDKGDNKLLELRNESGGPVDRLGMTIAIFRVSGEYKAVD